jgi:hypothetical protein
MYNTAIIEETEDQTSLMPTEIEPQTFKQVEEEILKESI